MREEMLAVDGVKAESWFTCCMSALPRATPPCDNESLDELDGWTEPILGYGDAARIFAVGTSRGDSCSTKGGVGVWERCAGTSADCGEFRGGP